MAAHSDSRPKLLYFGSFDLQDRNGAAIRVRGNAAIFRDLGYRANARNIILQVKGLYWQRSAITLAMATLNVPLTIWLLQDWGVLGAAISTGIAVMIGYVLIALLLMLRGGMEIGRYWLQTARGIVLLATALTALGLRAEGYLPEAWNTLVLAGLTYATLFGLTLYYFFAASSEERAFIDRFLRRFQGRGGRA